MSEESCIQKSRVGANPIAPPNFSTYLAPNTEDPPPKTHNKKQNRTKTKHKKTLPKKNKKKIKKPQQTKKNK
ncbi:hypothetical protein ACVGXN_01380, partial [Enterobacter hormaechei]